MSVACELGRTARPSRDGDERVADGAQLLLQTGAAAALATTALGAPGLAAGHAALARATVPDHLHVFGIGERLTEVAIEIGAITRHDEDLTGHGVETVSPLAKAVSPLQIVGHLWRGAKRARIHGINRRSGAGPDIRAIRLALANDQPRQLAAVAFEQDDLHRRRVESVFDRVLSVGRDDLLPAQRANTVDDVLDARALGRGLRWLQQLPVAVAAALEHRRLRAGFHAESLDVL